MFFPDFEQPTFNDSVEDQLVKKREKVIKTLPSPPATTKILQNFMNNDSNNFKGHNASLKNSNVKS